jgi:hypothetical protein
MGPGHRLGNRQGSPGAAPARNENGPGRLARQAFANLGRALAAAGPGQVAKITISVAGHRHEYRPAVGAARARSVRGPQTGRYRGRQRRWPGLSTHRGLGVPAMCSHRHVRVADRPSHRRSLAHQGPGATCAARMRFAPAVDDPGLPWSHLAAASCCSAMLAGMRPRSLTGVVRLWSMPGCRRCVHGG